MPAGVQTWKLRIDRLPNTLSAIGWMISFGCVAGVSPPLSTQTSDSDLFTWKHNSGASLHLKNGERWGAQISRGNAQWERFSDEVRTWQPPASQVRQGDVLSIKLTFTSLDAVGDIEWGLNDRSIGRFQGKLSPGCYSACVEFYQKDYQDDQLGVSLVDYIVG